MHLDQFAAQHLVSPDFWRRLSSEEQHAAYLLPLELLNQMGLEFADQLAASGNPIGAVYILRKHRAFETPKPQAPVIPRQDNFWSGLHTNDHEDESE